jgi:hypothetical protein
MNSASKAERNVRLLHNDNDAFCSFWTDPEGNGDSPYDAFCVECHNGRRPFHISVGRDKDYTPLLVTTVFLAVIVSVTFIIAIFGIFA